MKPLSAVQGTGIDEVFIQIVYDQYRSLRCRWRTAEENGSIPTRLWIAPPTRTDEHQLMEEGYYSIYGKAGAAAEMPGCSLCMGNQARVADNSTVVSTSTRNFPNRLGTGAMYTLASAEARSSSSIIGKITDCCRVHGVCQRHRLDG